MNVTLRALVAAGLVAGLFGAAVAKLPPPTPEQKAAAEAKKEKDAAAGEKAKKEVAAAEDRAVANYIANQKAKGVTVMPQMPAAGAAAAGTTANVAVGAPKSGSGNVAIGAPQGAKPEGK
jgi:hypothetical protein